MWGSGAVPQRATAPDPAIEQLLLAAASAVSHGIRSRARGRNGRRVPQGVSSDGEGRPPFRTARRRVSCLLGVADA